MDAHAPESRVSCPWVRDAELWPRYRTRAYALLHLTSQREAASRIEHGRSERGREPLCVHVSRRLRVCHRLREGRKIRRANLSGERDVLDGGVEEGHQVVNGLLLGRMGL